MPRPHIDQGCEVVCFGWCWSYNWQRFVGRSANNFYHHGDPTFGWRMHSFGITAQSGYLVFDVAPAYTVGPLLFQRDDGVLLTFRQNGAGEITCFSVNQMDYERLPTPPTSEQ